MSENPLHTPGKVFDLDLLNPNPSSSKTKDGPRYRVSFEVDRETWDWFMEADTSGMMIAAKAMVYCEDGATDDVGEEAPDDSRAFSVAVTLHASGFFINPQVYEAAGTDEQYQDWVRSRPCAVCGGCDWNEGVGSCEYAHVRRISRGAGTSTKPSYSGLPLCRTHHAMQHEMGEDTFYRDVVSKVSRRRKNIQSGREWFEVVSYDYLGEWCKGMIKSDIGIVSMSEATADDIIGWARFHGMENAVPSKVRDAATPAILRPQAS